MIYVRPSGACGIIVDPEADEDGGERGENKEEEGRKADGKSLIK